MLVEESNIFEDSWKILQFKDRLVLPYSILIIDGNQRRSWYLRSKWWIIFWTCDEDVIICCCWNYWSWNCSKSIAIWFYTRVSLNYFLVSWGMLANMGKLLRLWDVIDIYEWWAWWEW